MTSCLQNRVKGFIVIPSFVTLKTPCTYLVLYILFLLISRSSQRWPDLGFSAGDIPQVPNLRTKLPVKGKKGDNIYPQSWLIITFLTILPLTLAFSSGLTCIVAIPSLLTHQTITGTAISLTKTYGYNRPKYIGEAFT